ncbi:Di-sulfide bridge nucleocytoplasmic transport domain-containing protein [Mucor lusitanicus]|uniref:Di-sulfide bridge nucleocytoplasmic transport domain-containing protein n=1 Tax=Mucor circinelloides f. lusitanicus TaxID=29924 RepID=A0A8H4BA13_MUCCL|nr:Di-sulfide bridge nucleocytoplasmic transport domain-containing protein [Mucor lusitanicus]
MSVEEKRPTKRRRIQNEHAIQRLNVQRLTQYFTPDAPIIVGSYVRVILHSVGIGIILFVLYRILESFTDEIQARYHYEMDELAERARICHQNYVNHNCGPHLKGAVWQSFCDEWDRCRQFQAHTVGKTKIAAQVFGEVMNGFVEPLTLKAMLIICLLLFGFFIVTSLIVV